MNPDLEKLLELQKADSAIARLQAEVAALPRKVTVIEEQLASSKALLEKAQAALKADEANRRKYEQQIQDLRQKISKYRDQSLEVKTNDQYRALMHEIEFAEKDISGCEDKILESMVDADVRLKDLKAAETALKAHTAEIEKEKAEARAVTAQDEAQLSEWNAKRDQLRGTISDNTLRHYDRVFKLRGTALSEARDHKCSVCQVMLRPQVYNDVRSSDQLVVCDSCQRILYFDPTHVDPNERRVAAKTRRHHPKSGAPRTWAYLADYPELGEAYLALANQEGTSNLRVYDAHTGRKFGETQSRPGEYKTAFAELLTRAIRLNGDFQEDQLEEFGRELPAVTLDALQADHRAADAEAASDPPAAQTA